VAEKSPSVQCFGKKASFRPVKQQKVSTTFFSLGKKKPASEKTSSRASKVARTRLEGGSGVALVGGVSNPPPRRDGWNKKKSGRPNFACRVTASAGNRTFVLSASVIPNPAEVGPGRLQRSQSLVKKPHEMVPNRPVWAVIPFGDVLDFDMGGIPTPQKKSEIPSTNLGLRRPKGP